MQESGYGCPENENITLVMENQMEKKIVNEMETGII